MTQSLGGLGSKGGGVGINGAAALFAFKTREDEDLRQLRAAAVTKVVNEIQTVEDAVRHMRQVAEEVVAADSSLAGHKKLAAIERAIGTVSARLLDFDQRIVALEDSYKDFRKALLTEIKKEYINVPAPKNEAPRYMAIQPFELGDVRKKRRNTSVATTTTGNKKSSATAAVGGEKQTRHKRKRKGLVKTEKDADATDAPKRGRKAAASASCPSGGGKKKGPQKKKGKTIIKTEPTAVGTNPGGGWGGGGSSLISMLPSSFTQIKWEDEDN